MNEFMQALFEYFDPNHSHFYEVIILIAAACSLFVLFGLKPMIKQQRDSVMVESLVSAFYTPAKSLVVTIAMWQVLVIVVDLLKINLPIMKYPIITLLAFLHTVWYGFRVIKHYEVVVLRHDVESALDVTAITGIAKLLRLLLVAILAIVGFDLLGLDPSGLIALGSVSGAALAFASKDLVSNWFGGIMLYMDKPFKVGDWIRSPDREIEGVVEYIGWRITKIRTFDKRPLYVPNSLFNSITVQNPSRMTHRRIKETIGVRYDDIKQVHQIVEAINQYIRGSERIAQEEVIIVNFDGFGASSLNILIYCMTVTTDWVTFHQHKQTLLLDIANIINQYGCEFAYPTQRLLVEDENTPVGLQT
ncbi:MAG: mechanosensitive ion channel family protein [Gammaproteobacteria bacterium]|nr:mechanosensitive ion channel family protein [Gammaproteobacteria bacterium]